MHPGAKNKRQSIAIPLSSNGGLRARSTSSTREGSRSSTAPGAAAQVEKLDLEITLTLQQIDRNFARASELVKAKIIPALEKYGEESKKVWDSAAFWKAFFESSVNGTLSGLASNSEDEGQPEVSMRDDSDVDMRISDTVNTNASVELDEDLKSSEDKEFLRFLSQAASPELGDKQKAFKPSNIGHSTPKRPTRQISTHQSPGMPGLMSPYIHKDAAQSVIPQAPSFLLSTPIGRETVGSSRKTSTSYKPLDVQVKLVATPQPPPKSLRRRSADNRRVSRWATDFDHSSTMEIPHLESSIVAPGKARTPFVSPTKSAQKWVIDSTVSSTPLPISRWERRNHTSVNLTPLRSTARYLHEADSDSDIEMKPPDGMSPPVTTHFHVPVRRNEQSPARRSAKVVVDELLRTVAGDDDSIVD